MRNYHYYGNHMRMSDLAASGAAYTDGVKAAFQYSSNSAEQFATPGNFETYASGGFVATVPLNADAAAEMLQQLQVRLHRL